MTNPTSPKLSRANEEAAKRFHDLTVDLVEKARNVIFEGLKKANISGTQKWVIHSRVVNTLFNLHYQLSMFAAQKSDEQAMENIPKEQP